jgi:hypothetical protein
MKRITSGLLLLTLLFVQITFSQDQVDRSVIAKIKAEGFQNSKAMETLSYLVDVFGPRLTSSPNIRASQKWTMEKMTEFGLSNPRLEEWGTFGNGWTVESYSVELMSPTYDRINAMPLAWSPSTNGVITGEPMRVVLSSPKDFEKYRGELKDKIIMNGKITTDQFDERFENMTKRRKDEELAKDETAIDPFKGGEKYIEEQSGWEKYLANRKAVIKFIKDEGVAAMIEQSGFKHGVVRAAGYYETNSENNVPAFVISREQYARIVRLQDRKIPVQLKLNLQSKFSNDSKGYNIIAEIPGTDPKLKDEVVLLGGHFDSWHGGTGAVDNAAGCIAMLEAMRILTSLKVKPRRTIRIALWSGEEQDYFGSFNYVKKHYGDPKTKALKPDHEKLSAYYNLDNGSGKIRGVYLQGNEAVRPIFESYLQPFNYLGAKTLTALNTGGTDHMVFEAIGLPGFQFIQDPLDYGSRAHHSNLDVLEAVNPDDVKINAVIVASFAYHTAMRDERIPRKVLKQQ